jgi:hypothetical protein
MTIDNELLAKFEGRCWHEVDKGLCKHCGKFLPDNPSYSTSPDDRERLLEYLMGKKDMWRYFQDWACDVWEEDVDLVERGTSWNTEADRLAWLFLPLDGVPRWVSLLSEWLGMDSTVERFGKVKCSNCIAGVEESGPTFIKECTVCDGSGKVLAPWARWAKEGK